MNRSNRSRSVSPSARSVRAPAISTLPVPRPEVLEWLASTLKVYPGFFGVGRPLARIDTAVSAQGDDNQSVGHITLSVSRRSEDVRRRYEPIPWKKGDEQWSVGVLSCPEILAARRRTPRLEEC